LFYDYDFFAVLDHLCSDRDYRAFGADYQIVGRKKEMKPAKLPSLRRGVSGKGVIPEDVIPTSEEAGGIIRLRQ